MTLDLKLCAELLELDGKRTPGDWRAGYWGHPEERRSQEVRRVQNVFCDEMEHVVVMDTMPEDAAFIAAAPKLAEQLKAALEERERLRKALEAVIDHAQRCVYDYHSAMKGYHQKTYDAMYADMKLAREALCETEAAR